MNTLHLAIDDKFMPFAQKVFETAFPSQNQFRVMRRPGGRKFIQPSPTVQFVSKAYWFSAKLKHDLQWADCVIIHFMTKWSARAARIAPPHVLVVWEGWGADYYPLLGEYSSQLHLPLTKDLLTKRNFGAFGRFHRLAALADWLKSSLVDVVFRDWRRMVLPRLDVISMFPEEFEILKKSQPNVRATRHQLHYFSAETSFQPGPVVMEGPDVLLGNSASPTNNHLEAFEVLRSLELSGRKIIVPLSYGDRWYAEEICRRGKHLFGPRFVPLREYLSPVEYSNRLSTCGFVFMNHVRQEATGNVSIALLKGAKVFLRQKNLLTAFYKKFGAALFEFPEIAPNQDAGKIFTPLSQTQKEVNRKIVTDFWAQEIVIRQTLLLSRLVQRHQEEGSQKESKVT